MEESAVTKALFERYFIPTKKDRQKYVGIEIEMPIINLNAQAVDFSVIHKLTDSFSKQFSMDPVNFDEEGNICSLQDQITGDNLSYDCSYNNLELSLGKGININILHTRFNTYYSFIEGFLSNYHYTLTGLGINPYRKINHCVPILNERYRMLFHYLNQYPKHTHPSRFHHYPDFGTFSSASQVQIDVNYSDLVNTINTFTKLEPIKALLFSNSVMPEEETDLICVRDMLWENSMHGINPKNIGMYEYELASVDDLFEYIKQTSIYCIMRDGKYINFSPIPILQYFSSDQITGEYWNGNDYEKITFQPLLEDLKYHRTFKFLDLTFRGTIEFRSCCCQPISDSMTVAAFHTGLTENLELLKHLFDTDTVIYGHGISVTDLRKAFCQNIIPEEIQRDQLQSLCISILDLAKDGLTKRHFDEEHFLDPLYSRVLQRTNPALEYIRFLNSGSNINEIIQQYSKIGHLTFK